MPHVWLEKDRKQLSSLDLVGQGRFTLITSIGGDAWIKAAKPVSAKTGVEIATVTIGPGEKLAVLGPSGSGKPTLLNLVAGIVTPARGKVRVADVEEQNGSTCNHWYAERIRFLETQANVLVRQPGCEAEVKSVV